MSKIIFFRRRGLGIGSVRGMSHYINTGSDETPIVKLKAGGAIGNRAGFVRNTHMERLSGFDPDNDWLVRWGCTSSTQGHGVPMERQINRSHAIGTVGNKSEFRSTCIGHYPDNVPSTVFNIEDASVVLEYDNPDKKWILRPSTHSQGRNLWVIESLAQLHKTLAENREVLSQGWYLQEMIDKKREFRVYVMEGRVITVAEKIPDSYDDVAWNVAQGGEFKVLRWGEWPIELCKWAIRYHNLSGLDFSGVDMMSDEEGKPYVIEINSAPSLPAIKDKKYVSYRQKCMAKGFEYIRDNGLGQVTPFNEEGDSWKDVIHPAISPENWR